MPDHRLPPPEHRKLPGMLLTSAAQRKACFERDKGICAKCGADNGKKFQADHILALHAIPPSIGWPDKARFWRLENLQTMGLVCGCAFKKTAQEASSRAKVSRIQKRILGTEKPKKKVPARVTPIKERRDRPPVVCHLNCKKPWNAV